MPNFKWTIKFSPNDQEKQMFEQELQDLEKAYVKTLENVEQDLRDIQPSLLYYMEQFVKLNKQKEAVCGKIETLLEKTGRRSQEEGCGGCNE